MFLRSYGIDGVLWDFPNILPKMNFFSFYQKLKPFFYTFFGHFLTVFLQFWRSTRHLKNCDFLKNTVQNARSEHFFVKKCDLTTLRIYWGLAFKIDVFRVFFMFFFVTKSDKKCEKIVLFFKNKKKFYCFSFFLPLHGTSKSKFFALEHVWNTFFARFFAKKNLFLHLICNEIVHFFWKKKIKKCAVSTAKKMHIFCTLFLLNLKKCHFWGAVLTVEKSIFWKKRKFFFV